MVRFLVFAVCLPFILISAENEVVSNSDIITELRKLMKSVEELNTRMGNVETRIGNIETRIGNTETRIGNVETRIRNVESESADMKKDISKLKKNIADCCHRKPCTTQTPSTQTTLSTTQATTQEYTEMTTQVETTPLTTTPSTTLSYMIFYPPGSHSHTARRCYVYGAQERLCFVDYEIELRHKRVQMFNDVSLDGCMRECRRYRLYAGRFSYSWNGVTYRWADRVCHCIQYDYGHFTTEKISKYYIHYKYEVSPTTEPIA